MTRKSTPKLYPEKPLCQGKRRYATEQEALQVGEEQQLLNFGQDLILSTYRCNICGGWHLTRKENRLNK